MGMGKIFSKNDVMGRNSNGRQLSSIFEKGEDGERCSSRLVMYRVKTGEDKKKERECQSDS